MENLAYRYLERSLFGVASAVPITACPVDTSRWGVRRVEPQRVLCGHELFDRADLIKFLPRHFQVHVPVMLDGVSIRVQQCGVPVADGFVAFGAMVRQANVATEQV